MAIGAKQAKDGHYHSLATCEGRGLPSHTRPTMGNIPSGPFYLLGLAACSARTILVPSTIAWSLSLAM